MESIQQIKNRISTIATTRQITQSMRLVSTAKVQRAKAKMEANAPFADSAMQMVRRAAVQLSGTQNPYVAAGQGKRPGIILITSDRGLCGGYNINASRHCAALMEELGGGRLLVTGARGRDYFRRRKVPVERTFTGMSENPLFEDARGIATMALEWFDRGEVDALYLVYTHLETLLAQVPVSEQLLPLKAGREEAAGQPPRCEPGGEEFLAGAVPFAMAAKVYAAMLESAACEQSARITSMDSAVKNSDEMIDALSLRYNQARQGAITQEITEIVGGADALRYKEG